MLLRQGTSSNHATETAAGLPSARRAPGTGPRGSSSSRHPQPRPRERSGRRRSEATAPGAKTNHGSERSARASAGSDPPVRQRDGSGGRRASAPDQTTFAAPVHRPWRSSSQARRYSRQGRSETIPQQAPVVAAKETARTLAAPSLQSPFVRKRSNPFLFCRLHLEDGGGRELCGITTGDFRSDGGQHVHSLFLSRVFDGDHRSDRQPLVLQAPARLVIQEKFPVTAADVAGEGLLEPGHAGVAIRQHRFAVVGRDVLEPP